VTIFNKEYLLPLHSLTAFLWGIVVTWDFNTFPAFLLFSVGWAFVAINGHINNNPSPWHRCLSYDSAIFSLFLRNRIPERKKAIAPNQDLEKIEAYRKKLEERERRWQRDKELAIQHDEDMKREMGDLEAEAEEEDTATKKAGIFKHLNVNPLKPVLHPIQLQLRELAVGIRIVKSIVMWEESYFAFWITTASFFGSFVLFWIPFGFLIRWTMRVAAFVVLGPWM